MINVPRLGHTHHRMQEQHTVDLFNRSLGKLLMDAMERIARLKRNHIGMTHRAQSLARLDWREPQLFEIVVVWKFQNPQLAGNVELAPAVHFAHQRVACISRSKDLLRHPRPVPLIDLFDGHDGQQFVLQAPQCNLAIQFDVGRWVDRQRNGDGEHLPAAKPHLFNDPIVIFFTNKSVQG